MHGKYKILVTGAAGFIGSHLSFELCKAGHNVIGIDNLNDYYSIDLKIGRLQRLTDFQNFNFRTIDICDKDALDDLFKIEKFEIVYNLAAQAGVRHSIEKPYRYINSNLIGFINILEACRIFKIKHLFFASSSSVYGNSKNIPFRVDDQTDSPVSLYAATKKSNELLAYSYAHLYSIPITGLRFFTVYGPWGRPDMAYFSFTKNIFDGKQIKLYNNGDMRRDFTFIDDVINGILSLTSTLEKNNFNWNNSEVGIQIFNIGNNKPVSLMEFVSVLEVIIGVKANIALFPMQDGDVLETYADVGPLKNLTGFAPSTSIQEGLTCFVNWYKKFYKI